MIESNIDQLNVDLATAIRIIQSFVNKNFYNLELNEISAIKLRKLLSFDDLKRNYIIEKHLIPEIICFILPEDYQLTCLSIFESSFEHNNNN